MYRVWYSTESLADYIVDHTTLSKLPKKEVVRNKLYESDANHPKNFHTMPDHIRKILYLDAPDLIVEKDNEPVFSIEISTEAGTGHNAFQRFARIAASVENGVPAFYIFPEGKLVTRKKEPIKWDELNPLIFRALEDVMSVYGIPALLYYFPTDDIEQYREQPNRAPHKKTKGLCYENKIKYAGCPDSRAISMRKFFEAVNLILDETESKGVIPARTQLLRRPVIRRQRNYMHQQFSIKSHGRPVNTMSPLSAVTEIPTEILLKYLSQYETKRYHIGELLRSRKNTCIYQINAAFREDPYAGCLAAIDYLTCRQGLTFEDRENNLVMVWGKLVIDENKRTLMILDENGSTINDFFSIVQGSSKHNLLSKKYSELSNSEIPRYFMQVRYGSSYSKRKHIRVISYFADAVLFPDGSLWRDA